ncbi:hypothetical protein I4641_15890 [Waterburya agarophytonicola K14]|uniref:Uncharacterized protein n=1 Tax=Waterburya agarophytonicola KI4 TaxID=2874699 RepID=A0A964BRP5_9CYAN|nr:hypothetical protein [Waterburya agarophytonicola]MCC0178458.1 hypothetical protein [Waterburya agarophytonicola KI4]
MYVLSPQEAELRDKLEHQVRTGFVLRGQALRSIKRLQLYRDRFDNFESYCEDIFGFTMLYIERCMLAAETYYSIEKYLKTNGLNDPLPTKQRQLRPIFQAHLNPIEAGEVWVMAVNIALGKVPPASVVKSAVKSYLHQKYPPINPFAEGEICRIKSGVSGKQNCWCVVAEVKRDECVVDTWNDRFVVSVDDLMPMKFTHDESEQMLDLGERMTALSEVVELDEAALCLLKWLEKLNRATLNSLEERLLRVIEDEYLD